MRCDEFADRLDEFLDENRALDVHFLLNNPAAAEVSLADHARNCAACRELAVAYGVMMEGLTQLAVPEPAEGLAARVVAEVHTTNPGSLTLPRQQIGTTPRAPLRLAVIMAIAAALLLAVIPWLLGRFQEGEPAPVPIARKPSVTRGDKAAHHTAHNLDLAGQTKQSFVAAWPLVRALSDPWSQPSRPSEEAVTQPRPESKWTEQVAEGLSPLTQSTVGAMDSLWQAIPTDLAAEPSSVSDEEPRS